MGCIQSTKDAEAGTHKHAVALNDGAGGGNREIMQPRASVGGTPLSPKEIQLRIESCSNAMKAKVGSTNINYAWVSQRGYYPDSLTKPNQDSYTILPELAANRAFFAVYDGHGRDGHDCAYYCRDHVS
jgi:hypothetical protein